MALSWYKRLQHIKEILEDLYLVIDSSDRQYSRAASFGVAFVFNNLFEECWKLMKDMLMQFYGYAADSRDIAGPSNNITTAYEVGLVDSELWAKMLVDRNAYTHDYRNQDMEYYYNQIVNVYLDLVLEFIRKCDEFQEKN